MRVAPFRALTHVILYISNIIHLLVEMRVAPFRALTHLFGNLITMFFLGRNEGRPFQGIDTPCVKACARIDLCRNEGRPFQGIDTVPFSVVKSRVSGVEMRVAPFRALTHS